MVPWRCAMECYRVKLPPGARLAGFTATGQRLPILPGEYHVHRLRPKVALRASVDAFGPRAAVEDRPGARIGCECDAEIEFHAFPRSRRLLRRVARNMRLRRACVKCAGDYAAA